MDTTTEQQMAMDEALVPHAQRLRIGRSNFRLISDIKSKESTLQLVYDVLHICPFFKAFLVIADNYTDDKGDDEEGGDGDDDDEDDDGDEGDYNDADQEVKRDDDKNDEEEGGDDEHVFEEEEYAEETRDEESFDPISQTPKDSEDEGDGEEDLGLNVGEEDRHVKDEKENELYRDVNINQGRGIQPTLEVKDSHVTLTSVNPDGQQQSSLVSSQFVTGMLNPTLDV
nr:hypothetical protein [Tanacetum cinerariifolium]